MLQGERHIVRTFSVATTRWNSLMAFFNPFIKPCYCTPQWPFSVLPESGHQSAWRLQLLILRCNQRASHNAQKRQRYSVCLPTERLTPGNPNQFSQTDARCWGSCLEKDGSAVLSRLRQIWVKQWWTLRHACTVRGLWRKGVLSRPQTWV